MSASFDVCCVVTFATMGMQANSLGEEQNTHSENVGSRNILYTFSTTGLVSAEVAMRDSKLRTKKQS
jgi:hypothetical protein